MGHPPEIGRLGRAAPAPPPPRAGGGTMEGMEVAPMNTRRVLFRVLLRVLCLGRGWKTRLMRGVALFMTFAFGQGCASKPVLSGNDKLEAVGREEALKDMGRCEDEADKRVNSSMRQEGRRDPVPEDRRDRAAGAASGILKGDLSALFPLLPDRWVAAARQERRGALLQCLADKGYEVRGFD